MGFRETLEADASVFLNADEFADVVDYNGVSITAIIEIGATNSPGVGFSSEGESDKGYLWVKASSIDYPRPGDRVTNWRSGAVESRTIGDDATELADESANAGEVLVDLFGGATWQVVRIAESDGYMHRIEITSNVNPFARR